MAGIVGKHIFLGMANTTKGMGYLAFLATGLLLSCIERDNPWDPINLPSVRPDEIRISLQPGLDSLWARVQSIRLGLNDLSQGLAKDKAGLSQNTANAQITRGNNAQLRLTNAAIQSENNAQANPQLLKMKQRLQSLSPYSAETRFDPLGAWGEEILILRGKALARIDSANRAAFPVQIYPDAERSAYAGRYDSVVQEKANLVSDTAAWGQSLRASNGGLASENLAVDAENGAIDLYNDEIAFRRQRGNRPIIPNSNDLLTAIGQIKSGDSLFLDTGTFVGRLNIIASGTKDKPILIQGHPSGKSRITSEQELVLIDNKKHIIFRDLVFGDGLSSGVRVTNSSDSIEFQRCDFTNNASDGLEVVNSHVMANDCRFMGNAGNGIRFVSDIGSISGVYLVNVLVVHNGKAGIEGVDVKGSITLATLADNALDGFVFAGNLGDFSVFSSIVAYNRRYGINLRGAGPINESFVLLNCDVIGNGLDDFSQALPNSPSNVILKIEPGFISRDLAAGLDYNLRPDSPLRDLESSGISVGWRQR